MKNKYPHLASTTSIDTKSIQWEYWCVDDNTQLYWCIEANKRYTRCINSPSVNKNDLINIINNLGQSLATLFGMNVTKERTPALLDYIDKILPQEYNWNLKSDDLELYKKFKDLDYWYKDKVKHLDHNKTTETYKININKISVFMETTKHIWLWFLNKEYKNKIPIDQEIL